MTQQFLQPSGPQAFDPASVVPDFDPNSVTPDAPVKTGIAGELGRAVMRGGMDIVGDVGKAAQFLSPTGSTVNEAGARIEKGAAGANQADWAVAHPEQHGAVVNALAQGAEGLTSFLPTIAAGVANPIAGLAAAGAQMGLTGGQDTYENVYNATGDRSKALRAGLESGGIQAVGGMVGGKLVERAGSGLVTGLLGGGAAEGLSGAMGRATSPNVFKPALQSMAENAVALPTTIAAITAGSAAVEQANGVNVDPVHAALSSIPASLGMATLLAPFSAFGAYHAAKARAAVASDVATPVAPGPDGAVDPNAITRRQVQARKLYNVVRGSDPDAATAWLQDANEAIGNNQPVDISGVVTARPFKPSPQEQLNAAQAAENAPPAAPEQPQGQIPEGEDLAGVPQAGPVAQTAEEPTALPTQAEREAAGQQRLIFPKQETVDAFQNLMQTPEGTQTALDYLNTFPKDTPGLRQTLADVQRKLVDHAAQAKQTAIEDKMASKSAFGKSEPNAEGVMLPQEVAEPTPVEALKAKLTELGAATVPAKRIAKLAEMTHAEQIAHLDNMDLENSKAAYAEGLAKYRDNLKENANVNEPTEINQGAEPQRAEGQATEHAAGGEQPTERIAPETPEPVKKGRKAAKQVAEPVDKSAVEQPAKPVEADREEPPETSKQAWDQMRHDEYGDSKEIPRYDKLSEAHRDLWDQSRQSGKDFEDIARYHKNNKMAELNNLLVIPEHVRDAFDNDKNLMERADGQGEHDAAQVQTALKDAKTVGDAVRGVRELLSPKQRAVADRLLKDKAAMAGEFKLSGRDRSTISGSAVLGEHAQGDVTIHRGGGAHAVLHEAVHAKTAWGLRHDEAFRDSVKELFDEAKAALPDLKDAYMFKNMDEFLAEANSSDEMQAALDAIPSKNGKSVLGRLWDSVAKLLGLQPGQRSLLDDIMKVTSEAPTPDYALNKAGELGVQHSETPWQALAAPEQLMNRAVDGVLRQVKNLKTLPSDALKQIIPWHTVNHLADAFKDIAPGIGQLKGAWDKISGTHKALEIESALVGRQGNEWQAAISRRATGSQDVLKQSELSQRSTLDAIDPRFDPAHPLEEQKWYKELARHHSDSQELATAQEFLKASYKAENDWIAKMTPAEKVEYARNRANIERLWNENGLLRTQIKNGTEGTPENISGQDVFHREEFRLKQLGLRYNDESVKTWYENFYDPAFGAKETDVQKMREQIAASKSKFPTAAKLEMARLNESKTNMLASPYFHMFRPGDFYVKYKGTDGKTYLRSFESEAEAKNAWSQLDKQGLTEQEGFKGGRWADVMRDNDVANASALRDFINRATERAEAIYGVDSDEAKQDVANMRNIMEQTVLSSLSRGNNRTASAKRIGYEGALPDMRRSFATRTMYAHNAIAVLTHSQEASRALQELAQSARDAGVTAEGHKADPELQSKLQVLSDEMRLRQQLFTKPVNSPLLDALTNANYNFYLTMSPAYIVRNTTQPWVYTLPTLGGRYGFVAAGKALFEHTNTAAKIIGHVWTKDFFNPIFDMTGSQISSLGLRPDQVKTLQALAASGKADATFAYNTGAIARGATGTLSNAARTAGVFAHYSEVLNRITTALAAHDLEFARATKSGMSAEDAQKAAQNVAFKTVDDTQMDYSPTNKARMLGKHGVAGKATPLLTAFQQFNFQAMELMLRMGMNAIGKYGPEEAQIARKQLAGLMGTTAVFAGTLGLPFANTIAAIWDKFFGGSKDDPSDIKSAYRTWLVDAFGKGLGEVIARGVPRAAGFDLSQGVGMQDILPFSQFLADRRAWKDRLDTLAVGAAGPAYGILENMARGADDISNGNIWHGVETMLPRGLSGVAKASEMAEKGQFTDSKGNVLPIQTTGWQEFLQGLGLTPSAKAEVQEQNFAFKQRQSLLLNERNNIAKEALESIGTPDAVDASQRIQQWNKEHPDMPVRKINSAARRQAQQYYNALHSSNGMLVSRRQMLGLTGYQFANEGE